MKFSHGKYSFHNIVVIEKSLQFVQDEQNLNSNNDNNNFCGNGYLANQITAAVLEEKY